LTRSPGGNPAILANAVAVILMQPPGRRSRAVGRRQGHPHAGELLGIKVLDHIIIGAGRYFSVADAQLL